MSASLKSLNCFAIWVTLTISSGLSYCDEGGAVEVATANSQRTLLDNLTRPLSAIDVSIEESTRLIPANRFAQDRVGQADVHYELPPVLHYSWVAPELYHKPLYTEDVALERYGWSHGPVLQPFKSGVRFVVDSALIPYQMGLDHPHKCKTTLGYYRPGSCAPYVQKRLPWSWNGALLQTGAIVGAGALFQ